MSRPLYRMVGWTVQRAGTGLSRRLPTCPGSLPSACSSSLRICAAVIQKACLHQDRFYSQVAAEEKIEKAKELHQLVAANNKEGVLSLLPNVDVDAVNKAGWTALMMAARLGQADMLEILLQNGSKPGKICHTGQTAEEIAMYWNQEDCYKILKNSFKGDETTPVPWQQGDRVFFTHNPLDRMAALRGQPEVLEKLLERKNTHILLFHQAQPIVVPVEKNGHKQFQLFRTDYSTVKKMLRIHSDQLLFLGVRPIHGEVSQGFKYGKEPLPVAQPVENPADVGLQIAKDLSSQPGAKHKDIESWFAVDLPELTLTIDPSAEVMAMNRSLLTLSPEEAALCAQARSLLDWHQRNKLCPTCGSPTLLQQAGYRRQCCNEDCITRTAIYNSNYPRLDPSVITLVVAEDEKQCLLGRKPQFPRNMFSCLAGFIEPGESVEDAVRREVGEEVGIPINDVHYVTSQPWPMPSSLMLGLMAYTPRVQQIKLDTSELEGASWFSREDAVGMLTHSHKDRLFLPPAQAIGHQLVRRWVKDTAFKNI